MGRASKELKEKALAKMTAGESLEAVAKELGVKLATLEKWRNEKTAGDAKPPKASTEPKPASATNAPTPVALTPGPSLAQALAQHPGPDPLASAPIPSGPPPAPEKPPEKPLDAKALMAVVTVGKSTAIQMAAMAWQVRLTQEQIDELSTFTKSETEALETLAPYAAEYTPVLSQYAKPALAGAFALVMGMSIWRSVEVVKSMRPLKPQETVTAGKKAKGGK